MTRFRTLTPTQLAAFNTALGPKVEAVATGTAPVLRALSRRLGPLNATRRAIAALLSGARNPDIRALVQGNLMRKQARLPRLFAQRPVAALYLHVKGAQASLLRDRLRLDPCPDRIDIIFNGSVAPWSVLAAEAPPHRRLLIEAGFFPNTVQIDPQGLNGANSVPRDPAFYLHPDRNFAAHGLPATPLHRAAKRQHSPAILPARFVFVPFQVPSDMQITLHSPWVRDMRHFLHILHAAANRHPAETFVVKEHPSTRASIIGTLAPHPRIVFANGNATDDLITRARAVLTVNSTVGIAALQAGKPVITLGTACYDIPGLVLPARDPAALDAALARHDWHPDDNLRRQFLGFLRHHYLVEGSFTAPPPDLARVLANALTAPHRAWDSPAAENPRRRRG